VAELHRRGHLERLAAGAMPVAYWKALAVVGGESALGRACSSILTTRAMPIDGLLDLYRAMAPWRDEPTKGP
jgi:hypothetical protein